MAESPLGPQFGSEIQSNEHNDCGFNVAVANMYEYE